ncbi:MAG: hypothetical protein AAGA85_07300 [Bacteroidota bacterium]
MLKLRGTDSKWIVKGVIVLLVAVFAISPASSAEPVFESAEEVKEAYVHASQVIHLKARDGASIEDDERKAHPKPLVFPLSGDARRFDRSKIYLLHQCLKLFD